jgi:uncharacterized protein YbgA (DUF1722 family)
MRLVGNPDAPRLVTRKTGVDHTAGMKKWASKGLKVLEDKDLCVFIFKSKSPISGHKGVKVYSESGMPSLTGTGIFAGAFIHHFPIIPVEDEGRLHDSKLRENFIERIFVFNRWRKFIAEHADRGGLVSFHTEHKLLLMSHSQKHYSVLGRIVANAKKVNKEALFTQYITTLMEGLKLIATVKKNTNVLMHILGYFRNNISSDEKKELLDIIENYHKGLIPLIAPLTLINHYVRKYEEPCLTKQHYLTPHPGELMLRNHV